MTEDNRLKKLGKLLVLWNRDEGEADEICYEIWNLFEDIALAQWNGRSTKLT